MAIDIRATVTCSLGTLISATLSDDYVQGTGLIKCKGSCEISGTITPAIGTVVTFSYTKGGVTRSVPRKLRVLSSFADPFRRTTKVELGCKLTYLQDLQEPINWDAFDDPENTEFVAADAQIVTVPIHASSVMDKCLTELGITASSNPLTNKFSVAEFDFGAGYVSILSDLLVSESYCGYLDTSEVLQVFALDVDGGTGPALDSTKIIDLGPIGVGQLPGEAVTVNYSSLKLKQPESDGSRSDPWVYTVTRGEQQTIRVGPGTYNYIPQTITQTEYEASDDRRITKQTTTKSSIAAEAGGSFLEAVYNELGSFPVAPSDAITETETTTYEYNVGAITVQLPNGSWYYTTGEITRTTTLIKDSQLRVLASFNLPWVLDGTAYAATTDTIVSRKQVVIEEVINGYTRTITNSYAIYGYTQEGQQLIATAGQNIETGASLGAYVSTLLSTGALHLTSTDARVTYGDSRLNNRLPSQSEVNNAAYADGGDPANGWRTESDAELELALGSATAQRRIEFSLPYAPDDTFVKTAGPPISYSAVASDAPAKAARYGRAQNRLLLGNRSGMNIQLEPERLPAAPFSPIVVQANGLSALYRANGTSWTMDSNGILVSTDALFWGGVGGTGTFWFPVAPGITTLPTTPAVVDGEMTVTTVVPVWNETVLVTATTRLGVVATSLDYALELLTAAPPLIVRTGLVVKSAPAYVAVSSTDFTYTIYTPVISSGASALLAAVNTEFAASVPSVSSGGSALVPTTGLNFAANPVPYVGTAATVIQPSVAAQELLGLVPNLYSGAAIEPPSTDVQVAGQVPAVVAKPVPVVNTISAASAGLGSFNFTNVTVQTNDIILLFVETSGDGSVVTPTAGAGFSASFQQVTGSPVTDVATVAGSTLQVWWFRAGGNATDLLTVPDSGDHQLARYMIIRGCVTSGNPWNVTGTSTKATASTSASAPAVTTTVGNTLVLSVVTRPNDSSSTTTFGSPTNSVLSNLVVQGETGTNIGNGGGFVITSGAKAAPGGTGTTTFTTTLDTTNASMTIALKP